MKVCMADIAEDELSVASERVAAMAKNGSDDVLVHPTDVSKKEIGQFLLLAEGHGLSGIC